MRHGENQNGKDGVIRKWRDVRAAVFDAVSSLQIPNLQEPHAEARGRCASTNSNPLFLLVRAMRCRGT
jgi:hypothetical protein